MNIVDSFVFYPPKERYSKSIFSKNEKYIELRDGKSSSVCAVHLPSSSDKWIVYFHG
jgi:hypothetical protein